MATQAAGAGGWISYEDFLAAVDEETRAEWVDGEVLYMSPVSERHVAITMFLTAILDTYVERKGLGGRVLAGPFQMRAVHRAGREPDVLYVAPEHVDRIRPTFLDGPADFVVEVVSPESRVRDRRDKFQEYQQAGVREYWLIDPEAQTAEAFRLRGTGGYEPVPAGEPPRLRSDVIPGLWIDPAWLWQAKPRQWAVYEEWGLI